MKRSAKVLWIGFVFSTIVIAAVAGLVIYFTAFRRAVDNAAEVDSPSIGNPTASDTGGSSPSLPTTVTDSPSTTTPETAITDPATTDPATTTGGTDSPSTTTATLVASSNLSLVDHLSHAVPGFQYRVVDYDGDGVANVQLDGSRSHTHFYDEGPPIVIGKIVSMIWFFKDTGDQLATGAKPEVILPVGRTVLGLTVTDNYRDSHTDYTTVIVERPVTDGAYCYYYEPSTGGFTIDDSLEDGIKPIFAAPTDAVKFEDDGDFPEKVRGTEFQVRCLFYVETAGDALTLEVEHFGPVRVLVADEVIAESSNADLTTTEGTMELDAGEHLVQILYHRKNSAGAKLDLLRGGGNIEYDMSKVLPVLTGIDPISSTLDGGGVAKITGIGLFNDVAVQFGDEELDVDVELSTDTEVFVTVPSSDTAQVVDVTASNQAGKSNAVQFQFSTEGHPPIKFRESRVTEDGKSLELELITGIVYGPDHRYYASAINNQVHSFAANSRMQVFDKCTSPKLGLFRAILGLAFNPMDTEIKLYVSASVLDWKREEKLTEIDAWANGQILRIRKDYEGFCLQREEEPVITGLPVSNHDHGVNGLVFDHEGKLHIQVGGFTNAGHNVEDSPLGGIDENPLSGASLVADVTKPAFDGVITYTNRGTPRLAEQASGDVEVFSSGWRNSFGINVHSNGFLYATDNGASVGFGDMSTSCTTHELLEGENLDDKLGKVLEGKYAGHPNRNRGRKDPQQCRFRYPTEPSEGNYQAPIALFESSTNGVIEYTANTFGGELKGDILCSKYSTQDSAGKVFRVRLNAQGDLRAGPDELWASSGLSITMSPWGHILMPRVYKAEIMMLTPQYTVGILPMFTAVMPFRGPRAGGNVVLVTGENLGSGPTALFGDEECVSVSEIAADGRSFKCEVPAGRGGVQVSVKLADGSVVESFGGVDYRYMDK